MQLRSNRRIPTRFSTRVDTSERGIDVVIVDVTEFGAKADGLGDVPPGTECRLQVLGEIIPCIVRWTAGGSAGIGFAHKLTRRQLDVIRHRQTPPREVVRTPRRSHGFTELR